MPFVCTPRITNGSENGVSLQITDLFPHKTQSNAVLTPNFQGPKYLYAHGRTLTQTVALDGNLDAAADFGGLAAYILSTVEDTNGGGVALSALQANNIADDIISIMESGEALTEDVINSEINNRTAGGDNNGIGKGASTATVLQILQIVSGYKVFTLPAGTTIGDVVNGNVFDAPPVNGFFSDPSDLALLWTAFDGSFYLSARSGQLKKAQTRVDVNGDRAPFVVCYADDGSLIQ